MSHVHGGDGVDHHGALYVRGCELVESGVAGYYSGALYQNVNRAAISDGSGVCLLYYCLIRYIHPVAANVAKSGKLILNNLDVPGVDIPDYKSCCTFLQGHAAHYSAYARCSTGYKHICILDFHSVISITGAKVPLRAWAGVRK